MKRLQILLASGLGLGYAPLASGTFGSLPGLALVWLLFTLGGMPAVLAGCVLVTAIGVWAANGAERHYGRHDPGEVVIDEVAGQMIALLFLPQGLWIYVTSFFLFRLFDVIKPFPARRFEALPGGSGIMADDLVAGIYANLVLQVAHRALPMLTGPA